MSDTQPASKRVRRPRAAVACTSCRTRKVKCDGKLPCASCVQSSFQCAFPARHSVAHANSAEDTASPETRCPSVHGGQIDNLSTTAPVTNSERLPTWPEAPNSVPHNPHNSEVSTTSNKPGLCSADDPEPEGLGEINCHTEGSEYYGRTGTFYFLSRLQSRAVEKTASYQQNPGTTHKTSANDNPNTANNSVVNLLHSSDYAVSTTSNVRTASQPPNSPYPRDRSARVAGQTSHNAEVGRRLERECARLFFTNLHCIHPILDQLEFLSWCENEVWSRDILGMESLPPSDVRKRSRQLALFNIVLALGAITASETSLVMWSGVSEYLDHAFQDEKNANKNTYLPIKASQLFFERSKFYLDDTFESSSFEAAQTLFLMAVFCQNALKPHSCYMYAGMALRTALAIGVPTTFHSKNSPESRLWWGLYSFEMFVTNCSLLDFRSSSCLTNRREMSSSSGRQSFLREPSHYRLPLPKLSGSAHWNLMTPFQNGSSHGTLGPPTYFIYCMVGIAEILLDISANTVASREATSWSEKSSKVLILDRRLSAWKDQLPEPFILEQTCMNEAELVTKQKIVLRLRYLNARILLHRPFLLSSTDTHGEQASNHMRSCLEAASETIRFMHTTYMHRPYFRTWWYNCTYLLDATMVLLYVILSNVSPVTAECLILDIEKSLEIFSSMKQLAVARRCREITREVLAAARSHQSREGHVDVDSLNGLSFSGHFVGDAGGVDMGLQSGFVPFSGLVDTNLVFDFLDFEDWTAWIDAGNPMGGS